MQHNEKECLEYKIRIKIGRGQRKKFQISSGDLEVDYRRWRVNIQR